MQKKSTPVFRETRNIMLALFASKNARSAVDPRNVSQNFGTEILKTWTQRKASLNHISLPSYFLPMRFKDLAAEKVWEELLFNKMATDYMLSFSRSFHWHVPFLWSISGKCLFLWRIHGNPSTIMTFAWRARRKPYKPVMITALRAESLTLDFQHAKKCNHFDSVSVTSHSLYPEMEASCSSAIFGNKFQTTRRQNQQGHKSKQLQRHIYEPSDVTLKLRSPHFIWQISCHLPRVCGRMSGLC